MKKRFQIPVYAGIILVLIALAGCQNVLDQSEGLFVPGNEEQATAARAIAAPINIGSVAEFKKIGDPQYPNYPLNGQYILTANLTLSDWTPIGNPAGISTGPFTGSFDGSGHTIRLESFKSSLSTSNNYFGVFGYVQGASSTAKASLTNISIASEINVVLEKALGQAVGLLAGYTENTVIGGINLIGSFTYTVPTIIYAGGIVGYAQTGTVISLSTVSVTMNVNGGTGGSLVPGMSYNFVGGIVGMFKDGVDILNCINMGDITANCTKAASQVFCGGIAGGSYYQFTTKYQGRIENCYSNNATITAKAPGFWSWAGGIAGVIVGDGDGTLANTTRIVHCQASGTVTVEGSTAGYPYVGGIVGYNYYGALVSRCSFDGQVLSNTDGNYTGGIAGYNSQAEGHNSRIEDCWSSGLVRGLHNAGGIVGQNQIYTYVKNCYSTAIVITSGDCSVNKPSTNPGLGGIAGFNASAMADSISNCVALNSRIRAATGNMLHRIVGNDTSKTLSNNYALETMPISTGGTYTPVYGPNEVDGKDVDTLPDENFYVNTLGWDFADTWYMDSSGYPKLQ
jgi:hypothetical protein